MTISQLTVSVIGFPGAPVRWSGPRSLASRRVPVGRCRPGRPAAGPCAGAAYPRAVPDPSTYRPAPGTIPEDPGVYKFRDERGRVIYVGKAKSLRSG